MEDRPVARVALALALLLLTRATPWGPDSQRPASEPPGRGAARLLWGLALDLNREEARALEALPGIGPARARGIVAGRPYCSIRELDRVAGIGPTTLRRLAGRVKVEPSAVCIRAKGD